MADSKDSMKKGAGDSSKGKGKAKADESSSEALDQAQLVKLLRDMQTGGQACGHICCSSLSNMFRSRKKSWISANTGSGRLSLFKTLVSEYRHI